MFSAIKSNYHSSRKKIYLIVFDAVGGLHMVPDSCTVNVPFVTLQAHKPTKKPY